LTNIPKTAEYFMANLVEILLPSLQLKSNL